MTHWIYLVIGFVSIFTGLITFWLPIPIGLPLIILGLPLLMKHSPRINKWIHRQGSLYPRIGRLLNRLRMSEAKRDRGDP